MSAARFSIHWLVRRAFIITIAAGYALFGLAQAQTVVSPHPETGLTAEQRSVLDMLRQVVGRINAMSDLSAGDPGYVPPAWVTLYQPGFDSPPGPGNQTRLAGDPRDATVTMVLVRSGPSLYYEEVIPDRYMSSRQCVIRFADDFWALSAQNERLSHIAHEAFHCFQQRHKSFWQPHEQWIYEGAAQFVGDYFGVHGLSGGGGDAVPEVGRRMLSDYVHNKKSLQSRDYDATGFFNHLAEQTNINELLLRLQRVFALMAGSEASVSQIYRTLVPASDKGDLEETWAAGLWQAREPFSGEGDDWDYDYFGMKAAPAYETLKYDFAEEDDDEHEFDLPSLQPELIELRVQPNNYYRVTFENAEGRSIGAAGGSSTVRSYLEEKTFTFCVGDNCECPGGGAYEFEVLDDPEDEDTPHLVIAAVATDANEVGGVRFGKVKVERLPEPPCCTGGLRAADGFPDITGEWRFRERRLQVWADKIRETKIEPYLTGREADCTRARVDNRASVRIQTNGGFLVDFGGTSVEFTCEYIADSGTNPVERTWRYEWYGGYQACLTLQEADSFRLGYPERSNPVMKRLVEGWFQQMKYAEAYNSGLDEDEGPVTMGAYQPSATANAFWEEASGDLDYRQEVTIRDNDGETVRVEDNCNINLQRPRCEVGEPRIIGEYFFFAPGGLPSWFDVFGPKDAPTGIYAPLPFYMPEFEGATVEYPNLVR